MEDKQRQIITTIAPAVTERYGAEALYSGEIFSLLAWHIKDPRAAAIANESKRAWRRGKYNTAATSMERAAKQTNYPSDLLHLVPVLNWARGVADKL